MAREKSAASQANIDKINAKKKARLKTKKAMTKIKKANKAS